MKLPICETKLTCFHEARRRRQPLGSPENEGNNGGSMENKEDKQKNGGTTDTNEFEGLGEGEEMNDDGEANMKQRNDEDGEEWKKTKMEEEGGSPFGFEGGGVFLLLIFFQRKL